MCTSILRIFDTSLAVASKKLAAMAVCSGRLLPFLLAIQGGAEEANHWVGINSQKCHLKNMILLGTLNKKRKKTKVMDMEFYGCFF